MPCERRRLPIKYGDRKATQANRIQIPQVWFLSTAKQPCVNNTAYRQSKICGNKVLPPVIVSAGDINLRAWTEKNCLNRGSVILNAWKQALSSVDEGHRCSKVVTCFSDVTVNLNIFFLLHHDAVGKTTKMTAKVQIKSFVLVMCISLLGGIWGYPSYQNSEFPSKSSPVRHSSKDSITLALIEQLFP